MDDPPGDRMTKARKVRLASRAASAKPRISHRKGKAKPKAETRGRAEKAERAEPARRPAMNARLAAMAAASAELEEVPEPVKAKAPPAGGVAWKDLEMEEGGHAAAGAAAAQPAPASAPAPRKGTVVEIEDAPKAAAKGKAAPVDEGVQVVAKAASKFSLQDLEVLKAAIKVKGAGVVIDGINLDELKWDAEGLVPIVAQDRRTGAVLQLGWGNKETVEQSLRTKLMTYWNREHGKPIAKGEGSGHPQRLVQMRADCDKDALLALVDQDGPACHLDKGTCWHEGRAAPVATWLGELDRQVQAAVKSPPAGSDLGKLMSEPLAALKAFVEDANTVTRSLQGKSGAKAVEHAAADTLYHLLVACRAKGVGLDRIVTELFAREIAEELQKKAA